jgi:hypothetical protein
MNGQYSHVLDININGAIRSDFNFTQLFDQLIPVESRYDFSWHYNEAKLPTVFDQTWLDYMAGLNLKVNSCIIFYKEKNNQEPGVHIDTYSNFDPVPYACNWVLPPSSGEMVWYDFPENSAEKEFSPYTKTASKYWLLKDNQFTERARSSIGNQLTLVRTNVPHNIVNVSENRWCISIRFYRDSKPITDWDSAVEYFKPFIKE